MRRAGSCVSRIGGLLVLALLTLLVVGIPLYVEVAGTNVPAVISAKREAISVRAGNWNRQLFVELRNPSPQTSDTGEAAEAHAAQIAVMPELYDRLRVGDRVEMRYAPVPVPQLNALNNVGFGRLAEQPPLGSLLARLWPLWWIGVGVALGVLLFITWSTPLRNVAGAILGVYVVGAGLYVGSNWPPPEPAGPREAAVATVRDLHRVTRIWGGRRSTSERAAQPFDIVELEFTPAGGAGPVIAVDQVDADSAPGLARGARLPIHYSVADHRWAQLDTAARTYYWKNLRTLAVVVAFVGLLLGGGWLLRRRRAARRAGVTP